MHHSFRNTFAPAIALIAFMFALLMAKWAGAADTATQTDDRTGKTVKCQIVYINGDAHIRCPRPQSSVLLNKFGVGKAGLSGLRVGGAK